jgi:hypothetical protein
VKKQDLVNLLAQYRAGLDAEIALLRQLDEVAARQRDVSESRDYERLSKENDARDQLTRTLVKLDHELRAVRSHLAAVRQDAADVPGYTTVVELRRIAGELVARILATDQVSMKALSDADLARKAALSSIERGETTLAAYRKVIAPPLSSAALVDRRG